MRTRGQRGRSRATRDLIATCIEIIEDVQPITVRGVCYRLFVAGMIDSMATKNTQKVSRLLVQAREEGLIPWDWIVDDSRQMEGGGRFTDLAEYARVVERSYRRDFWAHQSERVIVISEKSTVAGILRPVLDAFGVPFFAAHGFNSATKVRELAEEIRRDDRLHTLVYCGDFDCSGMHMSEVDLPGRLRRYGAVQWTMDGPAESVVLDIEPKGRFRLERIALTEGDIADLPSFPAKENDPRYQWYRERYGRAAWELDAMSPNRLRDRVEGAIESHIDPAEWDRHQLVEAAQRESVRAIAEKMALKASE